MEKQPINIVWLKRDLRTQDHEPLQKAEQSGLPYAILYLFEPHLISYQDTSTRHLQFIYHSLLALQKELNYNQQYLNIFYGEVEDVFKSLIERFDIKQVFSYCESGTQITWDRDKWFYQFCKNHQIDWQESQRDGITRGITNRDGWDKTWYTRMSEPVIQNTFQTETVQLENFNPLPESFEKELLDYPKSFQPAGEKHAWQYLNSFTQKRGFNYSRHISKPLESRTSCGRVSPYLAWGNLSIKQAYQFVKQHPNYGSNKRAFSGFTTRFKMALSLHSKV